MPHSLDVPTIAETIATARGMLSARARLDAQTADEQGRTAHAVATGAYLAEWDRELAKRQPWPDVIEYQP